jgi:hypothetical protein
VRPALRSVGPGREHRSEDQCHSVSAVALRDHSSPICIFLCFTRRPAASLGGVPRGVQDRVRERQEGLFAANQCRRVCNDWPLVAALLLVLPLIVTRAMNHAAIGEIIKYNGALERYAGDGVMVVFNDPVPVENLALQAVLMALELRDALGALTATLSRLGHEIGCRMRYALGPILMPAPTSLSLLACS